MIPKIGPGNELAIRKSVLIKEYTTPPTPLAASSPATTKDLRSRETVNAATANTATPMPGHGASPARNAPPIAMTTTNTTSVEAAKPTASLVRELTSSLRAWAQRVLPTRSSAVNVIVGLFRMSVDTR